MEAARKTWELENDIQVADPDRDALFKYDPAKDREAKAAQPWKSDRTYYKHVRISAVALLKMVTHAREGGSIEVMGLMSGTVQGDTFIVTDAYRLPVEGTETRVNAQAEAYEYMFKYPDSSRKVGKMEDAVGWYHSHPGYGCWLSGIDVGTQQTWQTDDPFVAVVIDPDRTVSAGKVEIGAFRTFEHRTEQQSAQGQTTTTGDKSTSGTKKASAKKPAAATEDKALASTKVAGQIKQSEIPSAKAGDFGAHANEYYALHVSHFRSTLDTAILESLWSRYWFKTLSANPLLTNRDAGTRRIENLAGCISLLADQQKSTAGPSGGGGGILRSQQQRPDLTLDMIVKAADRIAAEEKAALTAAEVKERIFGLSCTGAVKGAAVPTAELRDLQMHMQS